MSSFVGQASEHVQALPLSPMKSAWWIEDPSSSKPTLVHIYAGQSSDRFLIERLGESHNKMWIPGREIRELSPLEELAQVAE